MMSAKCPFCNSEKHSDSFLPGTRFNAKCFEYLKCNDCDLHYVYPFPNGDDFNAMYPPSYQSGVNSYICEDPYKKISGIRFSYGVQFDLIRKFSTADKLLDYGCGHGNFMINAEKHGLHFDGTEYNSDHVALLKKELPHTNFYTLDDFFKNNITYNVIRLSNVLEHLTNPVEITKQLIGKLNPGGILLVEGPVEMNSNLATSFRNLYLRFRKLIKGKTLASHAPTHIFFSNAKNQLTFFEKAGFKTLHYEITESEWPFPESFSNVKGIGSFFKFLIARLSMLLSSMSSTSGNTFIYVGRRPEN
jgi:2-polyprenyl-3-methyl-5-hydroxy-6-metoxy-1,4-benzoquinol methylase